MKREEAIRRMECCRNFLANNYSDMGEPNITAFNMAIKALQLEPREDAVSRQTVSHIIKSHIHEIITESGIDKNAHTNAVLRAIVNLVETMPSVTPTACIAKVTFDKDELKKIVDEKVKELTVTQRWIPVSERLPENDEVVLGTNSSNDLFETYTWDDCGEIKWYANGCFDVPVIAWMPLPEPYKAESEDKE